MIFKMTLSESLQRPYYHNYNLKNAILQAFFFGAFVFVFLYFFEAFRISEMPYNTFVICLAFGAITTVVMLLMNLLVPVIFPRYFKEENWTVGKQIFYTGLHVFLIAICNFLFFIYLTNSVNLLSVFIWFQVVTLAIAVFPVSFLTLYQEKRERNYFISSANKMGINKDLNTNLEYGKITIEGHNTNEQLHIDTNLFLFAKADDNYVELFYLNEGKIEKRIFRSTLKEIEVQLNKIKSVFRCHKSYLVNTQTVSRISGNAQGYRFHFNNTALSVPVSRNQNDWVKNRFAVHPESN